MTADEIKLAYKSKITRLLKEMNLYQRIIKHPYVKLDTVVDYAFHNKYYIKSKNGIFFHFDIDKPLSKLNQKDRRSFVYVINKINQKYWSLYFNKMFNDLERCKNFLILFNSLDNGFSSFDVFTYDIIKRRYSLGYVREVFLEACSSKSGQSFWKYLAFMFIVNINKPTDKNDL